MALHIVIDGYNLIRQSRSLAALDRDDMQAGRDALVDLLSTYKKVKAYPITVVFDGAEAQVGMPRRDSVKGIDVRYSGPGELADTVIKRIAGREKERALVVSSDNELVNYVQSRGAAVVSADEFENRLAMARYFDQADGAEPDEGSGWQPTTKKRGPAKRLPKQKRRMRKKVAKL
jgi:predicted RNA-binding protein with PIN domain